MKLKLFLISLVVALSSTVVVAEEIQVAQVTFKDQMINQANSFVERTVNIIATPFLSDKDVDCLARNIFYEAGSESTEGKVAVAMVTINRAQDPRYPQNVCGVVKQRTVTTVTKEITVTKTSNISWLAHNETETKTTLVQKVVCQFSWTCMRVSTPRVDDPRWIESREVAEKIARNGYPELQAKYDEAMHFHAVYVKPGWKLPRIGQTGNHIFYK